ncbi:hypothetical protein E4U13_000550 [Claviceps humidiphila]|uniref:Large ribosomal subunit protein mL50 n=1 Tax=Claviceps humidiphila TaxID=1294629 RepID=A0A9P7Q2Q0_9HYPO|nr:hypothetical protein E4U13_000550 [Claviceps humidiphila]
MARISRMRRLASLPFASPTPSSSTRPSLAACRTAISTPSTTRAASTGWLGKKVWKGEPSGPNDTHTQLAAPSNLPDEALERLPADSLPEAILRSRLALPPKRVEVTPEADAVADDATYVPATNISELVESSPLSTWWDQPGHWGEESEFRGFASVEKVTDKSVMEVYLRQATIEALSLRQQQDSLPSAAGWVTKKWREVSRSDLDQILAAEIVVEKGQASVGLEDATSIAQRLVVEEAKAEAETEAEVEAEAESVKSEVYDEAETDGVAARITPEEAQEMAKAWDASWKDLVLDEQLKFAIRKRIFQTTGVLVPDARLGAARKIKHILTLAVKKPTPPKLATLLEERGLFQEMSNVTLHSRRLGPIDREIAVGRWKVIEEELLKRNLPVTGTAGLPSNKERQRMEGKVA